MTDAAAPRPPSAANSRPSQSASTCFWLIGPPPQKTHARPAAHAIHHTMTGRPDSLRVHRGYAAAASPARTARIAGHHL
jgi:hypothetical protein